MYAATFLYISNLKLKRKAVPSCLQPASTLTFLSTAFQLRSDESSIKQKGFCCQTSNRQALPADVFVWDRHSLTDTENIQCYVSLLIPVGKRVSSWCTHTTPTCICLLSSSTPSLCNQPVFESGLIVPHREPAEQLPATVFILKVKGDVLTKYHYCYLISDQLCVGRNWDMKTSRGIPPPHPVLLCFTAVCSLY